MIGSEGDAINITDLKIENGSYEERCLEWVCEGNEYHVYLNQRLELVGLNKRGNGVWTRPKGTGKGFHSLDHTLPENRAMIEQAIAQATALGVFERFDAAEKDLLKALRLCKSAILSGYMEERSEKRRGVYTEAFEAADAAIKLAETKLHENSKE